MATDPPCPCGQARRLSLCCGRWWDGPLHLAAPDAQALMRSRYSAFARGRADYLLATWHASTLPADLQFDPSQRWLGLQVKHHRQLDDAHATVEFVAHSKLGGRAQALHETSRFVHEAGQWFYLDGDIRPVAEWPAR